jgi:hypothetical protein
MAGGTGNGLATAVELLGGFGDLGLGGDQQEELFDDADDAPSSLSPAPLPEKRPAHRPKGSRNRSTEEMRRFLLSRYQSPLQGCAETWSRRAEDLARELFLTREVSHLAPGQEAIKEVDRGHTAEGRWLGKHYLVWDLERAFRLQQEARYAALPYLHQKLPQAIEVSAPTRGLVILGDLGFEGESGDDLALPLAAPSAPKNEIVRNQHVSEAEIVKSDGEQSDGLTNALTYKDE